MPDNRFVLSVDNGIDQVKIYRFNDKEQRLVQVDAIRCELESAPRHFRYSKDGKFIYLMYELKKQLMYTPTRLETSTCDRKDPDHFHHFYQEAGQPDCCLRMRMSVDQKYIIAPMQEKIPLVFTREMRNRPSDHDMLSADQRRISKGCRCISGWKTYCFCKP